MKNIQTINKVQLYWFSLTATPAFWISIVLSIVVSPWWLLIGVIASQLRNTVSHFLYWGHTNDNLAAASEYLLRLDQKYCLSTYPLKVIFPETNDKYGPDTNINVVVARNRPKVEPITKYLSFTAPGVREALVIIGHKPDEVGPVLRFSMLHEIGHALFSGVSHTLNTRNPLLLLMTVYFPIYLMMDWWPFQGLVLVCLIWHFYIENCKDFSEVSADAFAVSIFKATRSKLELDIVRKHLRKIWGSSNLKEHQDRLNGLNTVGEYGPLLSQVSHELKRMKVGKNEHMTDSLSAEIQRKAVEGPIHVCFAVALIAYIGPFPMLIGKMADPVTILSVGLFLLSTIFIFHLLKLLKIRKAMKSYRDYATVMLIINFRQRSENPVK